VRGVKEVRGDGGFEEREQGRLVDCVLENDTELSLGSMG